MAHGAPGPLGSAYTLLPSQGLLPVFFTSLAHPTVTEQQAGSCCLLPPSRQNPRGKGLVKEERSLYSKATQFWNNSLPHALVTQGHQLRLNSFIPEFFYHFPLLVFNYLISIGLVYKLRQHKIQKLHNFGRMAGFCLRAHPL